MNNEPVAWIGKDELQFGFSDTRVTNEKESWDDIPLYTHPAKTLTDGIELLEKYADKLEDERPNKGLSDVVYECIAILKKASEK
jgi:hypothetical protein